MQKKHIVESFCLSLVITTMVFTLIVPAYAPDTSGTNHDIVADTVTFAYVAADYNAAGLFEHVWFNSYVHIYDDSSRVGYLWFWWQVDYSEIEWYTSSNSASDDSDVANAWYVSTRTYQAYSNPNRYPYSWEGEAFIYLFEYP